MKRVSSIFFFFFHIILCEAQVLHGDFRTDYNQVDILLPDRSDNTSSVSGTETFNFSKALIRDKQINASFLKPFLKEGIDTRIDIVPPDFSNFVETYGLIGVFDQRIDLNKPFIWIVCIDKNGRKIIYSDRNQDRNFVNDGNPQVVNRTNTKTELSIYVEDKNIPIEFRFENGFKPKVLPKKKVAFKNQFVLDLGLGAGSGYLDYTYDQLQYESNFTIKNISINANYYLGPVVLGVSSSLQSSNFYTSREIIDGIRTLNVNRDTHPKTKIQMGLSLAYRLKLSQTIELHPLGTFGYTYYTSENKYFPRKSEDDSYDVGRSNFREFGLRFVFIVGNQRSIYVIGTRNTQDWNPVDFGNNDFESELKMTRFEVGYSIGF